MRPRIWLWSERELPTGHTSHARVRQSYPFGGIKQRVFSEAHRLLQATYIHAGDTTTAPLPQQPSLPCLVRPSDSEGQDSAPLPVGERWTRPPLPLASHQETPSCTARPFARTAGPRDRRRLVQKRNRLPEMTTPLSYNPSRRRRALLQKNAPRSLHDHLYPPQHPFSPSGGDKAGLVGLATKHTPLHGWYRLPRLIPCSSYANVHALQRPACAAVGERRRIRLIAQSSRPSWRQRTE